MIPLRRNRLKSKIPSKSLGRLQQDMIVIAFHRRIILLFSNKTTCSSESFESVVYKCLDIVQNNCLMLSAKGSRQSRDEIRIDELEIIFAMCDDQWLIGVRNLEG